ncbi:MAG: hypothetical protein AAGA56_26725 [Myxococcota bacterium]
MRVPVLCALVVVATGCGVVVEDDASIAADTELATHLDARGVVSITGTAVEVGATRTRISARFVRLAGTLDWDDADHLVGALASTLPRRAGCVPHETESARPANRAADPLGRVGAIELLDLGEVAVRLDASPQARIPLVSRAFPDVAEVVSGLVYTSRDAQVIPDGARLVVEGGHTGDERFSVAVDLPSLRGTVDISPTDGAAASVAWEVGEPGDWVTLHLKGSGQSYDCSFEDTGVATIPGEVVRAIGDSEAGFDIDFHRLRMHQVSLRPDRDLDEVHVRVDLMKSFYVSLEDEVRASDELESGS